MNDTIHLDRKTMLARGGERMVFAHPDDPSRLIKVHRDLASKNTADGKAVPQKGVKYAKHQWGVIRQYDEYNRLWLWQQYRPDFHLPISHLYGFVKTNLGLGGVTERIADETGAIGPTFRALADAGHVTDEILDHFNDLLGRLYGESVCMSDTNPSNFVYGHRFIAGRGQVSGPEWVMVDGFGDRFVVPIRTWSKTVRHKGADESFARKFKAKGFAWNGKTRMIVRA